MTESGFIYFAQPVNGGAIKIGHSSDPFARLRSLNTASAERLRIIGLFPGSPLDEKRLHATLAAHRLSGEWFRDCPEVLAVIAVPQQRPKRPTPVEVLTQTRDALTLAVEALARGDYSTVCETLEREAQRLHEGSAAMRSAA